MFFFRRKKSPDKRDIELAIENSSSSIIITSLDGKIEYVNHGFEITMGYSRSEVIGKNATMLQSSEPNSYIYEEINDTLFRKKTWVGELKNKKKDGEVIWEKVTISPVFNDKNEVIKFVTVKENITAERQARENLLESYRQLQEIDSRKSEFMSIASHELRTPLTVIRGYSSMFLDGTLGELNDKQKDYMQKVFDNSTALISLVKDMLDVNKLEVGKMEFKKKEFLIGDFLKQVAEEYKDIFKERGLKLSYRKKLREKITVMVDPNKLKQVLSNLLGNAMKFSEKGTTVHLHLSVFSKDPNMVVFEVRDEGIGIPEDQLDKIFDKFVQVDNHLQRDYEGTGLGLTIVREIVSKLGGQIWVESKLDLGSSFFFTIPRTQTSLF